MRVETEERARQLGLEVRPVEFEKKPDEFFREVNAFKYPGRFIHWSFGGEYKIHKRMEEIFGNLTYELVYKGDTVKAYVPEDYTEFENKVIEAHVLSHADFLETNKYWKDSADDVLERIARDSSSISDYEREYGREEVEKVLDAALTVSPHIKVTEYLIENAELEDYEKHLLMMVSDEEKHNSNLYETTMLSEGWASYAHELILKDILPLEEWGKYSKMNSEMLAHHKMSINPGSVGKAIFKEIERKWGMQECLRVRQEYNDLDFLQEYLDEGVCKRAELYVWERDENNKIKVNYDAGAIKNALTMQIKNSGHPVVEIENLENLDTLKTLKLKHIDDERGGLDAVKSEYFIKEVYKLWKKPVKIRTIIDGNEEWMIYNGYHTKKSPKFRGNNQPDSKRK